MRRHVVFAPVLLLFLLLLSSLAAACSSTDSGTIQILITNADTFTGPPAVTTLSVIAIDTAGDPPTTLKTAALPATTIDLGLQNENEIAALQITGADANGVELISGASLPVEFGGLAGISLPIFVQRLGQLVPLPPGTQGDSRPAPTIAEFQGQYLFIGGGSDTSLAPTTQIYDFSQFALLPQPPTLPLAPVSSAFVGTVALLIDASGAAIYFDFASNTPTTVTPPAGASFSDVAGGETVISDLGTEFIVGATRTSCSSTVLEINPNDTSNSNYPNGNLTWLFLTEPRCGAAAAWASGFGLVVAAGSDTGSGAELLALPPTTSTSSTTTTGDVSNGKGLPFPPDASVGAGATSLGGSSVLLAGGIAPVAGGDPLAFQDAGVRMIDIGCPGAPCPITTWETSLPEPIMSAQAFELSAASAFVVGNEPFSGATHAFVLTTTTATEVPMTPPHTNATATLSPVGSIVVVGGANDIQSFLPATISSASPSP
ncbi:MAG: hypothetical protein ACLP1X_02420 [Polyangiaceae bacterium]|jgi:hypothetical protein